MDRHCIPSRRALIDTIKNLNPKHYFFLFKHLMPNPFQVHFLKRLKLNLFSVALTFQKTFILGNGFMDITNNSRYGKYDDGTK